jgi:branched-chain amino acid transport system substrate-binding protein
MFQVKLVKVLTVALFLLSAAGTALAQKQYGPGVTDTEIKIGQTMPYSGPASAYGTIGRVEAAYFNKINAEGGINGRKINFISLDDAYSPPKTVEQTRKLIEQEDVFLIFGSLGTATNSAIHKYVNVKHVPHVFISAGAAKWADPQNYPWTMPWNVPFQTEAHIYAKFLLKERPNAKIAMLYQNDDFGRDYIKGLRDGLGEKAGTMIVAEASYEATDPTVDSQIVALQASGADTFFNVASPKFGAQAIRKVYDLGWRPLYITTNTASSIGAVLTPAGLDKSTGIISAGYFKADPTDPTWREDPGTKSYLEFMKKYYPDGDLLDGANVFGYSAAQLLVYVLKQCGDNLTRENVMRQATSLKNVELPMLLPGMRVNTSPTDYRPLKQMQLFRFDGKRYVPIGDLLSD